MNSALVLPIPATRISYPGRRRGKGLRLRDIATGPGSPDKIIQAGLNGRFAAQSRMLDMIRMTRMPLPLST